MREVSAAIPRDVEPYLIGLWRFRGVGQPKLWFATFAWRGAYYDVYGCRTPEQTINKVRRQLAILRRKRR